MDLKMRSNCVTNHMGSRYWYKKGKLHRLDGPAIEYSNGDKQWYLNGKRHRLGGPAIEEHNGTKCWYVNGKLHRTDGPACEWFDGSKFWCIDDKDYTFRQWLDIVWDTLSIEDQERYIFNGFEYV